MFTLTVFLESFLLTGFEALDWRRAHNLPDGTSIYTRSDAGSYQSFVVNEEFARKWFDPRWASGSVYVSLEELRDEEFQLDSIYGGCVKPCLSRDRAIELFVDRETKRLAIQSDKLQRVKQHSWFWNLFTWSKP